MENQTKIIFITSILTLGVFLAAIFWPKITSKKPPSAIKKIREEVKGTKIGNDLLNVLGKETANEKTPTDRFLETTGGIITNTTNAVLEEVKEEITKIVIEKSSEKIIQQLNLLPDKEKEEIKEKWCK